ncbi:OFCC1 protein, partial [Atractosteus spatula]|nr:OFCC1 protein [Atractosteus spatula]
MKDDRQDSTLAAHQQKTGLHVHTKPRGNERTRNYFDPPLDEEINPRRYGAEGSTEDELELKLMRENDKELYHKMSKMLEDAEATIIDLPVVQDPVDMQHLSCNSSGEVEDLNVLVHESLTFMEDGGARPKKVIPSLVITGAFMPEEGSAGPAVEAGGGVPVLSSLRQMVHDEVIPCYDEHFKECVQDDMIALGSLSLEQEARSVKQKRLMLGKEQERGKRLMSFLRGNKKVANCIQNGEITFAVWLLTQLLLCFRAESQLLKALKKQKGEVTAKYGELTESGTQSNGEQGLRWQVGWRKAPQPVEIQIRCLRGVRDKLPKGRYALRISLYSRLGGQVLRWSKIRDHQWAATTSSVGHGGNFYDSELQFTQSVFIVLPAPSEVQPEMILLFEMLSLPGENTPSSDLFGWGAFPVCDCRFEIVEGQFKCPLLRGQPDPAIDQFRKIEDLMSSDLDNWLCNLYFQVKKLPRCDPKHQEYEVTLQIPQACQSPDSLYTCWVTKRHQKDCNTKESHLRSQFSLSPHFGCSSASQQEQGNMWKKLFFYISQLVTSSAGQPLTSHRDPYTHKGSIPTGAEEVKQIYVLRQSQMKMKDMNYNPGAFLASAIHTVLRGSVADWMARRSYNRVNQRVVGAWNRADEQSHPGEESGWNAWQGRTDKYIEYRFKKKPAQKSKSKSASPCHDGSASSLQCGKETAQCCLCADELDEYRFSLQTQGANTGWDAIPRSHALGHERETQSWHSCGGRSGRRGAEHTQFVLRALLSELGLSQWRSREFWLIMLLLTFIWFLRLYLHYCSQWLFLQAISVPVNKFQFCLHTVKVVYQNSLLHTREELAMVVVGPLTLNVVMLLMVLIRWGCQLIFGSLPSLLSKFIMAMGVWTVLDPLAVFAVDAILGHLAYSAEEPIADVMKLYWHFHRTGNSAVLGIMITLFLYVVLFICSCTTIYIYFLRLHNNGRILDVFLRLHSKEGAFFIPHDLELSNQELNYIVKKAEQWRGIHGERRKGPWLKPTCSHAPRPGSRIASQTCLLLLVLSHQGGDLRTALQWGVWGQQVAVYDYIWTKDPSASCDTSSCDPQRRSEAPGLPASQEEISTHVSVYTIHLSGLRKPYRQFLREPDGAIVEVRFPPGLKSAFLKIVCVCGASTELLPSAVTSASTKEIQLLLGTPVYAAHWFLSSSVTFCRGPECHPAGPG